MKGRWKNLAGSIFAAVIMAAVLYLYGGGLASIDFHKTSLAPRFVAAVGVYSLVVAIGAVAWGVLLSAFGAKPSLLAAERQLLISQIAKYVPGNIAQYVGRAAMAIKDGTPATTAGIAIICETALVIVGGILSVIIAIAMAPNQAARVVALLPDTSSFMWIGVALATVLLLLMAMHFASKRSTRFEGVPAINWTSLGVAILLYTTALFLLGTSFHVIVGSVATPPLALSVAVFSAAWIAGLATPGAPGGLGVRESVITVGLAPFMGGAAALSAALLHRGASVIGDVICLGIGLMLPTNEQATPKGGGSA